MSLRSTKRALVDLTWASSCISSFTPQSAASTVDAAKSAIAASASAGLAPVVIEVEPVVRSAAAVVLEARGVALQDLLDRRAAPPAGYLLQCGEPLEADLVAVAPAIDAEHERDGPLEHRRNPDRTDREGRGLAEKRAGHRAA